MHHHRAFGRGLDDLDVVIVDDHKPMQSILRSILNTARVARLRSFDGAAEALRSMAVDPPDLAIVDWRMAPVDGMTLVAAMRRIDSGPLVHVPVIMITGHPTRRLIARAVRAGIHAVLAKPISPALLIGRIAAVTADSRQFVRDEESGSWRLDDAVKLLAAQGYDPAVQRRIDEAQVLTLDLPASAPSRRRRPAVPFAPNPVDAPIPLDAYRIAPPAAAEPAGEGPPAAASPARSRPRSTFAAVSRAPRKGPTGQRRAEAP